MTKIELHKKIEIMRAKLHDLIEQYGVESDIVLDYSQKLDKLLCKLEKMKDKDRFYQNSKAMIGDPTHK